MDSKNTLGKKEAIYFVLIVIINKIILNLPKIIIQDVSSGSIVSILISRSACYYNLFYYFKAFKKL